MDPSLENYELFGESSDSPRLTLAQRNINSSSPSDLIEQKRFQDRSTDRSLSSDEDGSVTYLETVKPSRRIVSISVSDDSMDSACESDCDEYEMSEQDCSEEEDVSNHCSHANINSEFPQSSELNGIESSQECPHLCINHITLRAISKDEDFEDLPNDEVADGFEKIKVAPLKDPIGLMSSKDKDKGLSSTGKCDLNFSKDGEKLEQQYSQLFGSGDHSESESDIRRTPRAATGIFQQAPSDRAEVSHPKNEASQNNDADKTDGMVNSSSEKDKSLPEFKDLLNDIIPSRKRTLDNGGDIQLCEGETAPKQPRMMVKRSRLSKCPVCGAAFTKPAALEEHIAKKHCDAASSSDDETSVHWPQRKSNVIYPYHCDLCVLGFDYLTDLKSHNLRYHTGPRKLKTCADCGICFQNDESYSKHMRKQHGVTS